jgi:hypothetical protein
VAERAWWPELLHEVIVVLPLLRVLHEVVAAANVGIAMASAVAIAITILMSRLLFSCRVNTKPDEARVNARRKLSSY